MQVELLSLCDAAADYQGKLSLLGAFDTIAAASFPITHPQCAIAVQLRFSRIEEGEHAVRLHVVNQDGRLVVPALEGKIGISPNPDFDSASANLILALQGLKLPTAGDYAVNLAVDGRQEASIPLYVRQRTG